MGTKLTALVPVADGSEEIETTCIADTLVRAGFSVVLASCLPGGRLQILASRGVKLLADKSIEDVAESVFDVIALPGGVLGAEHLRDCATLITLLRKQQNSMRWIAAICAAPAVVLEYHGLLVDTQATCHPAFIDKLQPEYACSKSRVLVDWGHKCITSQGPGTAIEFALAIITVLAGEAKAREVAEPMILA